jgi:hypothetical protein
VSEKDLSELKPCGLYRTTRALPGKEEQVPEGRLVYYHNHSEQGPPLLLLPSKNTNNRWTFHQRGHLVEDADYIKSLAPLPREGFYVLRSTLSVGDGFIPERSLVQLGYNGKAEPILFPGKRVNNSIEFPLRGVGFKAEKIFQDLDPVSFLIQASDEAAKAKSKQEGGNSPPGSSTPPTIH